MSVVTSPKMRKQRRGGRWKATITEIEIEIEREGGGEREREGE